MAREIEEAVAAAGAVPATIAVVGGEARVGLDDEALERVADGEDVVKVGVRDLAPARPPGRRRRRPSPPPRTSPRGPASGCSPPVASAASTATRATRGTSRPTSTMLAGRGIVVVCAGVKSILDVGATLERLETLNVTVLGYRTDRFPGFYLTESGFPAPWRVESAAEVAAVAAGARPSSARRAARLWWRTRSRPMSSSIRCCTTGC